MAVSKGGISRRQFKPPPQIGRNLYKKNIVNIVDSFKDFVFIDSNSKNNIGMNNTSYEYFLEEK